MYVAKDWNNLSDGRAESVGEVVASRSKDICQH